MRGLIALALFLAAAAPAAFAADPPLQAYRAATLLAAPGRVIAGGTLLVRGKVVEGVLEAGDKLPPGAALIDLGDVVLAPALVNPLSSISERGSRDRSPPPGVPSQPARDPRDGRGAQAKSAIKPQEAVWRRLGRTGFGAWGWIPDTSGFLAGHGAAVRPRLGKETDAGALVLKEPAFLLMSYELGKRWRETAESELKKAAEAIAKESEARKAPPPAPPPAAGTPAPATAPAPSPAPPAPPKPSDPLVRALKGEVPLWVRLRSPAAIDHFFRLYDKLSSRPKMVLVTSSLPPAAIDRLKLRKEHIAAVVVEPRLEPSGETSVISSAVRSYLEAGFKVALTPLADTLAGHEDALLRAAEVVKGGASEADVLAAMTTVPAELLGLQGKVGVLAPGAFASFAVHRGEPFSGTARLAAAYVEGTRVYHEDAATLKVAGEAVR